MKLKTCLLLRIFGELFFINALAQDLFNASIKAFTISLLYEIYHPHIMNQVAPGLKRTRL